MPKSKTVIYIDMDDTLCDFRGRYQEVKARSPEVMYPQSQTGFFLSLAPLPRAVVAFHHLSDLPNTDVYILTAPSVRNPHSYTEKRLWIENHLGLDAAYRLILCPNKALLVGDYLIDDHAEGKGRSAFRASTFTLVQRSTPTGLRCCFTPILTSLPSNPEVSIMVNITPLTIERLAIALSSQYRGLYRDGLVMRLGQGWEANNAEAIFAWLQSRVLTGSHTPIVIEQVREHMAVFLRTQSEQLWERSSYAFPQPQPFLPQIALDLPQCRTLAHALIEMLATWQPIEAVVAHCAVALPGKGNGVQKLTQWLYEQQACFNHHPSELTEPLGHELIRVLYPAFKAEY